MSGEYSSIVTFVFVVAIAMAAYEADNSQEPSGRKPASLSKREMVLGERREVAALTRRSDKVRGPLTTSIAASHKLHPTAGESFVITGHIVSEQDLSQVKFKWAIPDGIELVNGEVSGVVQSLLANQPYKVSLTVKKLSNENRQIHFAANAERGGAAFGSSAQYNTEIQTMLDEQDELTRSSLKAKIDRVEEDQKKEELKVFH